MDEKAAEFKPVREFMLKHPAIDEVYINVGMPMEFDPRKGETPKPDGIEFKIPNVNDLSVQSKISEACEKFGMRVKMPDFKQPGFTYTTHRGEERVYNEDVDYDAFVRLVPDRGDS